jgi:hypothetical protein
MSCQFYGFDITPLIGIICWLLATPVAVFIWLWITGAFKEEEPLLKRRL